MPTFNEQIYSKLPKATTTIFSKMSALANQEQAINLSQGFPNFPVSKVLINLVEKAMHSGFNQYAPMPGNLELREVIVQKVHQLYNVAYHPETEITITSGATQAIYTAISAFVQQDDEVVIFAPAYDCYAPTIALNGGKTIEIEMEAPYFKVDWMKVKARINDKTKMIIINTPHNPSGTVWSKEDMENLVSLVKNTNIILISDEVYEHIIFDGIKHQSAALYTDLAERTFIISSFGKTFHTTGWKLGYCIAPAELMAEFRKVHQFNVFSVNHPMQKALAEYLKTPNRYLSLPDFYQKKRDFFLNGIKNSRFDVIPSQGTYFQLLGYKSISEENDVDFAIRLTKENKIASIPISVFYNNKIDKKVLRFCFSKDDKTLFKATELLSNI